MEHQRAFLRKMSTLLPILFTSSLIELGDNQFAGEESLFRIAAEQRLSTTCRTTGRNNRINLFQSLPKDTQKKYLNYL